jgi:hypothetical protein
MKKTWKNLIVSFVLFATTAVCFGKLVAFPSCAIDANGQNCSLVSSVALCYMCCNNTSCATQSEIDTCNQACKK